MLSSLSPLPPSPSTLCSIWSSTSEEHLSRVLCLKAQCTELLLLDFIVLLALRHLLLHEDLDFFGCALPVAFRDMVVFVEILLHRRL